MHCIYKALFQALKTPYTVSVVDDTPHPPPEQRRAMEPVDVLLIGEFYGSFQPGLCKQNYHTVSSTSKGCRHPAQAWHGMHELSVS